MKTTDQWWYGKWWSNHSFSVLTARPKIAQRTLDTKILRPISVLQGQTSITTEYKLLPTATTASVLCNYKHDVAVGKLGSLRTGVPCARALPSHTSRLTSAHVDSPTLTSYSCVSVVRCSVPLIASTRVLVLVSWDLLLRRFRTTRDLLLVRARAPKTKRDTTAIAFNQRTPDSKLYNAIRFTQID